MELLEIQILSIYYLCGLWATIHVADNDTNWWDVRLFTIIPFVIIPIWHYSIVEEAIKEYYRKRKAKLTKIQSLINGE